MNAITTDKTVCGCGGLCDSGRPCPMPKKAPAAARGPRFVATCGLEYVESADTLEALLAAVREVFEAGLGESVAVWDGGLLLAAFCPDGSEVWPAGRPGDAAPPAGFLPGPPPWLTAEALEADRECCAESACGRCGREGLLYRPCYRAAGGRGQYRAFAVCPACGAREEF